MNTVDLLIVEDSASLRRIYTEYMRSDEISIDTASTLKEARDALLGTHYKAILLDLKLPDGNGFDLFQAIMDTGILTPVIIMTAHGSINMAVEAMRLGAYDFLEKPFDAGRLRAVIRPALSQSRQRLSTQAISKTVRREQFHGFIGASESMQAVYRLIERAAPSKASVFITGESGTGKELCAAALHRQSARIDGPFIALNCAAIPKELIESEIFGHIKGAFTGAASNREGAASMAHEGTLFLDEIGEMDLDLQSKLLRFIQSGVVQKVGSNKEEVVDVRFICATNRDPLEEVKAGRFREDLYYRLFVIPIELPALRDRSEDVLQIANLFLSKYAREEGKYFEGFDSEVEAIFSQYNWPGNVRQLQNIVRNIVVLNRGGVIDASQLPPPLDKLSAVPITRLASEPEMQAKVTSAQDSLSEVRGTQPYSSVLARSVSEIRPLLELERMIIENAIGLCDGNIPKAAAMLGLSPSTVYRKRQAWEEK
jgi:two-component system repressor protein LuxO